MAGLEGNLGVQALSSSGRFSQDYYGNMLVAQHRAPGSVMAVSAKTFAACIPPGTGQAPGTAIGTTAAFTLALASGSAYRLVIRQISVGYISGTLGAGVLAVLAHTSAGGAITAPTGGTAITPTCMLLGSNTTSQANCRFNNTVPASGIQIRSVCSLGASLASTAVQPWQVIDNVDGSIVVGAGQAVSVQAIAAGGSSPLVVIGMVWDEESSSA